MTRMTGTDCAVMCNLIIIHTYYIHSPDCAVIMCNLINIHTAYILHKYIHTYDNGNENRIGEGGREAKKRKKPQNSCRRRAGNGGDMGGKRKKCRKERVGSVAANPDNLGSNKEAGGEHKVLRAQVRFVQVERVCPLCRV